MSPLNSRPRLADIVSLGLNPSAWTGIFFCGLAMRFEPAGLARLAHAALGVIFAGFVPIGLVFLLKARGHLSDVEMSVRSERQRNYLWCALGYGLGAALLFLSGASWPLWGIMICHVPNTLILIVANRRLKVSIHTMVLTSIYIGSLMFFGMRLAPLGIFVLASAWARWQAGRHSPAEVLSGILMGGVLSAPEIYALKALFGN